MNVPPDLDNTGDDEMNYEVTYNPAYVSPKVTRKRRPTSPLESKLSPPPVKRYSLRSQGPLSRDEEEAMQLDVLNFTWEFFTGKSFD
jgi:hypothetical protein